MAKRKQASLKPAVIEKLERLDAIFNALSHPARRQMLMSLKILGPTSAGDIAARFSCAWPTVTRHLNVLREAGLVTPTKRGRSVVYVFNPDALKLLHEDWLRHFE
jgi:DNA-binding transcriptional ArsR family regulator